MAIAKLKNGETLELPFEEMQQFVAENLELIEKQPSQLKRRRQYSKTVVAN